MKIVETQRFRDEFDALPPPLQTRARKQLALLLTNPRHRSLLVKKLKGYANLWEGRLTDRYRFTFTWEGDTVILRRIGPHDIERRPGRA